MLGCIMLCRKTKKAANLAQVVAVAAALALVGAVLAGVVVDINALEPAIQRLLQVVQVLGRAVGLALAAARVGLGQAGVVVQAVAGREPAIVLAKRGNDVAVGRIETVLEYLSASVDVVLYALAVARAVGVVATVDLHEARGGTTFVGVARRLLHGNEGEELGANTDRRGSRLESVVVLCARTTGVAVEVIERDGHDVVLAEHWRVPAVGLNAAVEPRLGAIRAGALLDVRSCAFGTRSGLRGRHARHKSHCGSGGKGRGDHDGEVWSGLEESCRCL